MAQVTNALSSAHVFQLYISSHDHSAQTLSLDSVSIGYIRMYGLRLGLYSVAATFHQAAVVKLYSGLLPTENTI